MEFSGPVHEVSNAIISNCESLHLNAFDAWRVKGYLIRLIKKVDHFIMAQLPCC